MCNVGRGESNNSCIGIGPNSIPVLIFYSLSRFFSKVLILIFLFYINTY